MASTAGKITAKNSLFLFRHVITGQIVPSRTSVLKLDGVWKHLKEPYHKLRKDHWKPISVVSGFEQERTADIVWHSLATYPNPIRDENWYKIPRRLRDAEELDQSKHKLSALCRILTELPEHVKDERVFPENPSSPLGLTILWETNYFKEIINANNLSWPEFVKHGKLDLIRGRNIVNPELRVTALGKERKAKLHEMHEERINTQKSNSL